MCLLVQIHYHHGRYVELMEKMEQISGNPPHVLEWRDMVWLRRACREFLWNLLSVVWSSILLWAMEDRLDLDSWNILWRDLICVWDLMEGSYLCKTILDDPSMDNRYGWSWLNLDSYQLPLCPCVIHITVTLTCGNLSLVEEFSRWHTRAIWDLTSWMLARGIIFSIQRSRHFIFWKFSIWHTPVGSCHFSVPPCCL